MNIYLLIIYFSFITTGLLFAQEDKIVAKVGDYIIYESEFSERFDFSIHPKLLQKSDRLEAKTEFLKQLIAEKLLSLNARDNGFDTLRVLKNIVDPLENMFVRDALYKQEIKNKVSYTPSEITEGLQRINKILKIKFIYSQSEQELQNIFLHLNSGASFDSVLMFRVEAKDQGVPRAVTFGTMEKFIEDSLYSLKPEEFTSPLASQDGYYILKLVAIENNPDLKAQDMTIEDVKKIVETRAEFKIFLDYHHNFFNDFRITADKEIFENLIKIFVPGFRSKYSSNKVSDNNLTSEKINKFYLNGIEVTSTMQLIDPELQHKIFIDLKIKQVRVDYFLNQLSHDGYHVRDTSEKSIRASLSSYIRKFIEDELLTAEGTNKGLKNSPDVKKYISMWKDSYLSKMLMVDMFDSIKVNEEEAYSIYNQNDWKDISPDLVNIVEVLSDSLEIIEKVLNELSDGKDIRELARLYTKRDSLKELGGEFGFFPVTQNGEIGKAALNMKIGDIHGPIKLEEGYSIFQLIDRRADTTTYTKSYSEIREELITYLTLLKFEKYVNEYNSGLALKYGVEIDEGVLKNIESIYLNLIVVRYMGFGGEILAVPYTEQFPGWYDVWQQKIKSVP